MMQPTTATPLQQIPATFSAIVTPLASIGIPVIPLLQKDKRPALSDWQQKATCDMAQIEAWNAVYPGANCGCVARDEIGGFWFLDFDDANLAKEIREKTGHTLADLTYTVRTSKGLHFYFRQCETSIKMGNVQAERDGRELFSARVHNRFVVGPGSTHPSGSSYMVLFDVPVIECPEWLFEWIKTYSKESVKSIVPSKENLQGKITKNRNKTLLSLAGSMRKQGLNESAILSALTQFNTALCSPPLAATEVAKIAKNVGKYATQQDQEDDKEKNLNTVSLSNIKCQKIKWLWQDRIPAGKLVMFSGRPDVGKTTITCDIIARYANGSDWGDGTKNTNPGGRVLMVLSEDSLEDTIKPRLLAAGLKDVSRIEVVRGIDIEDGDGKITRRLSLDTDLSAIKKKVAADPSIGLIVIDPITSYLGRSDMNKEQDLRRVLDPLEAMCIETGVTIIALGHFNKRQDASALELMGGATAMSGVGRAAWLFFKDPSTSEYSMVPGKGNLSKNKTGLHYSFEERIAEHDDAGQPITAPYIEWLGQIEESADAVLSNIKSGAAGPKMEKAKEFLLSMLADGPRLSSYIFSEAEKLGIGRTTIFNSKKALGIKAKPEGRDYFWRLPDAAHHTPGAAKEDVNLADIESANEIPF